MTKIEEATPGIFEEVLPLLEGFENPGITRDQWRSLFYYSWPCHTDNRGFILRHRERVVGFFGAIWSERQLGGAAERICNITSWITLREYRSQSLRLLRAIHELKDCTITCLSPAPQHYPLYQRLGFRDLETKLCVLLPCITARLGQRYRIISEPDRIAHWLQGEDERIFAAHRPHSCGHLLVLGPDDYCYLVFTRTKGLRARFAHIHYLSSPEVFVRVVDRVRLALFRATRTPLVMLNGRLAAGLDLPLRREVQLRTPYIYRSATLAPPPADNLYSELILLGL